MKVITAPETLDDLSSPSVFLAGSIEGDRASRWQDWVISCLGPFPGTLVNPRRKVWCPEHSTYRHPELIRQIQWELEALTSVDYVFMYFDPDTISPISLLEQGWFGFTKGPGRMFVVCPPTYFRATNVEQFCEMIDIKVHPSFEDGLQSLVDLLLQPAGVTT